MSVQAISTSVLVACFVLAHEGHNMEIKINDSIVFDEDQQKAVEYASDIKRRIVAVSGAAGSGKTTIIRRVYNALRNEGYSVALAAPTGKAARRIKEATGIAAVTIHKLLNYNRPEIDANTGKPITVSGPGYTSQNRLPHQVIIVDEYAMVNHELHNNLIAALPSGGVIRAFGDIAQLPPIEEYKATQANGRPEKTPFQKLLDTFDSVQLNKVYRQGEGSAILHAADKIRKGHFPPANEDLGDFYIKLTDRPVDVLKLHIQKSIDAGVDYRLIENQIITPTKKGWTGTQKLNQVLKALLNPRPEQSLPLERHKWDKTELIVGIGDKVVCTANTYDLRDFSERFSEFQSDGRTPVMSSWIPTPETKQMLNGETGVITHIYPDGGMDIDFGDRTVEVPNTYMEYWSENDTYIDVNPSKNIDLAYALTTHKCQGSEFQQVCYIINSSAFFVQSRQNFYTAVTRARKRAMVLTDQKSFRNSVLKVSG